MVRPSRRFVVGTPLRIAVIVVVVLAPAAARAQPYRQLAEIEPPNLLDGVPRIVFHENHYNFTVYNAVDYDEEWRLINYWPPVWAWMTAEDPLTYAGTEGGTFEPPESSTGSMQWTPPDTPGADLTFTLTIDDSPLWDDQPAPFVYPTDDLYSCELFMPAVTDLQWIKGDGNLDLEPGGAYGGKKIWPGKKAPDDEAAGWRRYVFIDATITPVHENVPVYFKVWDVDDPSADGPPIDTGEQGDNRGTHQLRAWDEETGAGDPIWPTSPVLTNDEGVVRVVLCVSLKPGDNYRVTACANVDTLAAMTWAEANVGDAPKYGQTTELLTVWRKLHVECDSMGAPDGPPPPQDLFGTLTGASTDLGVDYLEDYDTDWRPWDQLTGSLLDTDTGDSVQDDFIVSDNITTTVWARNQGYDLTHGGQTQIGAPYEIDTDDEGCGDVPEPPTSVLVSAFEDCFVGVVFDTGEETTNCEFVRNLESVPCWEQGQEYRGATTEELSYWTAYIQMAYESEMDKDGDPSSEEHRDGLCKRFPPEYGFVFYETARENARRTAGQTHQETMEKVAAHEIGHQFDLDDDPVPPGSGPKHLMYRWSDADRGTTFKDNDIAKIRNIPYP